MGGLFCKKKDLTVEEKILGQKTEKLVLVEKLMHSVYKEKFRGNNDMLQRLAACLSDVEEIKESYLISDWVETMKVHRAFDGTAAQKKKTDKKENVEEVKELEEKGGKGYKSTAISESTDNLNPSKQTEGDDDEDGVTEIEIKEGEKDPMLKNLKLENKVKIKIIVSEVAQTKGKKNFRRFISPILSRFDYLPKLGMFHSALMVGPWLIEWNNSAICIPRKCVSRAALLSADVDTLDTKMAVETAITKLAEVIVKWNSTKLYHDTDKNKDRYGNCQDFVDDVLKSLGIEPKFEGPLGKFLRKLRTTGNEKLVFEMDEKFRKKFEKSDKIIEFKTHLELDEFVASLYKIEPEFESKHRYDYSFLKSFDRAFWMKHFKFPDNEDWKCLKKKVEDDDEDDEEAEDCACPFEDPQETFSIR